jgi:hypothetical protein
MSQSLSPSWRAEKGMTFSQSPRFVMLKTFRQRHPIPEECAEPGSRWRHDCTVSPCVHPQLPAGHNGLKHMGRIPITKHTWFGSPFKIPHPTHTSNSTLVFTANTNDTPHIAFSLYNYGGKVLPIKLACISLHRINLLPLAPNFRLHVPQTVYCLNWPKCIFEAFTGASRVTLTNNFLSNKQGKILLETYKHANLQILSDDVLYMVSPQTHYLISPPCKPTNLIRWCTWCHCKLTTTWHPHHANLQIIN